MIATRLLRVAAIGIACLVAAVPAHAQALQIRGFFQGGLTTFTARDSFETILGSSSGPIVGGGGGVIIGRNIFASVSAERFSKDGRRKFVFNGEVFDLGIDETVTITPLHVTGGYRYPVARGRVVPYGGGGISWYRYRETDEFTNAADQADERFTGFHIVGGTEFPVMKWLAAAGEVQWTAVPDALGASASSVASAFGESDLGGTTIRFKVVVGR